MNDSAQPSEALSVPVPVDIVIGTKTLTLSELAGMKEGHVIEWEGPFPESARLVVAGREIGTGRVVRVGDHLGVVVEALRP